MVTPARLMEWGNDPEKRPMYFITFQSLIGQASKRLIKHFNNYILSQGGMCSWHLESQHGATGEEGLE